MVGQPFQGTPGSATSRLREEVSLHCSSLDLTGLSDISLITLLPALMRTADRAGTRTQT